MQAVVNQVNASVGAHAQGLAHGLGSAIGAHRDDGDLAAVGLGDLQGFLDCVLVEFVHDTISGLAVQRRIVGTKLLLSPGIRDLLDAHCDLHGWPSLCLPLARRCGERCG